MFLVLVSYLLFFRVGGAFREAAARRQSYASADGTVSNMRLELPAGSFKVDCRGGRKLRSCKNRA